MNSIKSLLHNILHRKHIITAPATPAITTGIHQTGKSKDIGTDVKSYHNHRKDKEHELHRKIACQNRSKQQIDRCLLGYIF